MEIYGDRRSFYVPPFLRTGCKFFITSFISSETTEQSGCRRYSFPLFSCLWKPRTAFPLSCHFSNIHCSLWKRIYKPDSKLLLWVAFDLSCFWIVLPTYCALQAFSLLVFSLIKLSFVTEICLNFELRVKKNLIVSAFASKVKSFNSFFLPQ